MRQVICYAASRMKKLIIIFIAAGVVASVTWTFLFTAEDFTSGRSTTCELHGVGMSKRTVDFHWGMKAVTEMARARDRHFPHADEPYDSGYCLQPREHYARVFVCTRCTAARTSWLATN